MSDATEPMNLTGDAVIGVIGSPSTNTALTLDILGEAASRKLVGELSCFSFVQDGKPHYAIGQVTEVSLLNTALETEDSRMAIRDRGAVAEVSGARDTYRGTLVLSAVFGRENGRFFPSMLGTVPPTGTSVSLVDDRTLDTLLQPYLDQIFYLGRVYGSTPRLPLWFKHFGRGAAGAGEAYHLGIFGKTGSGKSVLAKTLLMAYARHTEMAIFIIDPQAEFAMELSGATKNSRFDLKLRQVMAVYKRPVVIKNVNDLVLTSWELFTEVIRESNFFPKVGVKEFDERQGAAEDITRGIKGKFNLHEITSKDAFFQAFKYLGSESSNERFQHIFKDYSYHQDKFDELYETGWKPVCELFRPRENAVTIKKLVQGVFAAIAGMPVRPVVIINLSGMGVSETGLFWNEAIQSLVIRSFLDTLKENAEQAYMNNQFLNSLVILDEAHRIAPREAPPHGAQASVRDSLIDAVRTTRKYGLGWLFISQTLASLPKSIVEQLRIMFFGFGLAYGNEYTALKEIAGGEESSLRLYQSFRDPHSAFDEGTKRYNFMSIGPVSPLSFSGTPLFFTAFNDPGDYFAENRIGQAKKAEEQPA